MEYVYIVTSDADIWVFTCFESALRKMIKIIDSAELDNNDKNNLKLELIDSIYNKSNQNKDTICFIESFLWCDRKRIKK